MEDAIRLLKQKESEMTKDGSDVAKNLAYSYRKAIAILERCDGKSDSTSEKDLRVCDVVASFSVRKCSEFPPKSDWFDNSTSEKVFAKCKTIHGKITNDVVIYDFFTTKWRFMSPGSCEVIEWYDPN